MELVRMVAISGASNATGAVIAPSAGACPQFANLMANNTWLRLNMLVRV